MKLVHSLLELILAAAQNVYVKADTGHFFCAILDMVVSLHKSVVKLAGDDEDSKKIMEKLIQSFNQLLPKIGETVKKSLVSGSTWKYRDQMDKVKLEIKVYKFITLYNY